MLRGRNRRRPRSDLPCTGPRQSRKRCSMQQRGGYERGTLVLRWYISLMNSTMGQGMPCTGSSQHLTRTRHRARAGQEAGRDMSKSTTAEIYPDVGLPDVPWISHELVDDVAHSCRSIDIGNSPPSFRRTCTRTDHNDTQQEVYQIVCRHTVCCAHACVCKKKHQELLSPCPSSPVAPSFWSILRCLISRWQNPASWMARIPRDTFTCNPEHSKS